MKNLKEAFSKSMSTIKFLIIISLITSGLMSYSFSYVSSNEMTYLDYLGFFIAGFILVFLFFSILFFVVVYSGILMREKNVIGASIFTLMVLIILAYLSRTVIEIAMIFYSENLGIERGQYLNNVIAVFSLIVAIIMPYYITERNRKLSWEIIENNRLDAYRPVLSYSVQGVSNKIKPGLTKILHDDVSKIQELLNKTFIVFYIENVTERIAINVGYRYEDVEHNLQQQPLLKEKQIKTVIYVKDKVKRLIESNNDQTFTVTVCFEDIYGTNYTQDITIKIYMDEDRNIHSKIINRSKPNS